MCGFLNFFGDWKKYESALNESLINLKHRGPDDSSINKGNGYWMGFCRLSIQDVSVNGRQPMLFNSDRYLLTFNGEIYNFKILKEELIAEYKEEFVTGTDTEVLGKCLLNWGYENTLKKLRGMFSFVFFDKVTNKVILARDNFGIKPLYYYKDKDCFIISSEFRSIYSLGLKNIYLSPDRLGEFFYSGAIGPINTLCESIKSFLPGDYGIFSGNDLEVNSYWESEWSESKYSSKEDSLKEVYNGVLESVKTHLISDVPVGLFLSGGLDSSIICGCMKKLGMDIKAFSIGWGDNEGVENEVNASKKTAKFYDVDFKYLNLDSDYIFNLFDNYISSLDLPTGDGLNTYLVSEVASKHVKVVLNGIGADELCAGYGFHRMFYIANRFKLYKYTPKVIENILLKLYFLLPQEVRSLPSIRLIAMIIGTFGSRVKDISDNSRMVFNNVEINKLLKSSFVQNELSSSYKNSYLGNSFNLAKKDEVDELLLYEIKGYLLNTLLRDSDNLSMAHSIELRVPLVDKNIFAIFSSCHSKYKVNPKKGKTILREAFADMLPEHINNDFRKKGFNLPMMKWLKEKRWQDRITDSILDKNANIANYCDQKEIKFHVNKFYKSEENSKLAFVHYQKIWLCLILENWLNIIKY